MDHTHAHTHTHTNQAEVKQVFQMWYVIKICGAQLNVVQSSNASTRYLASIVTTPRAGRRKSLSSTSKMGSLRVFFCSAQRPDVTEKYRISYEMIIRDVPENEVAVN